MLKRSHSSRQSDDDFWAAIDREKAKANRPKHTNVAVQIHARGPEKIHTFRFPEDARRFLRILKSTHPDAKPFRAELTHRGPAYTEAAPRPSGHPTTKKPPTTRAGKGSTYH